MKISVIIPYHKGEAYLRDCLDSLVEQSGQQMEILVICDHVKKKDLAFIKDYEQDLDIKMYHLSDRTGVAAARNLGLDQATGDYVYFLDSDDYLYDNTLLQLAEAAQDRDDDIIYGKKKPTWFQRSVFLIRKQEQELADMEQEEDESSSEDAQLKSENGDDEGADSGDDSEESSEDGSEEGSEEGPEDTDGSEPSNKEDHDDENEVNQELTEEELASLRDKSKRRAYRILVGKRKGVRNISVLNILFKRSLLEEHRIRFPEQLKYFSDVPFLLEALSKTNRFKKRFAAKYIKRKHNDPVNFPSLSQIKDPNRFNEFIDVYYETVKRIGEDEELRKHFDKKYISYYTKIYAPRLKRSSNELWRTDNFLRMSEVIGGMNRELFRKLKWHNKQLIKALIKKDLKKSIRVVTVILGYRKLKRIIRNRKALASTLYIHWFLKKPLKENWIIFESFFGKSYSDNPKYIYEYLAKNYPNRFRFIWVIDNKASKIPYRHKKIRRFSLSYYYYLARCKYCVFNSRQPEWMIKNPGNVFLQTWHGTPLKKLVFDIDDISSATPKYKQQVYKQSRAWDYLIAANEFSSKTFRSCFLYEKDMLETGYPRNDIMHSPDKLELARKIKKRLGIPADKKAVLYAPTWRDDEYYGKGKYKFELKLDLELIRSQLGEEYVILLRTHYFIADSLDVSNLGDFAYNLSKYDDISELYLISDLLITDYSSVFFDYANLKRPILFFTYDLDKYRDVLRGFYFDIEREVPGPLLFTTEEIIDAIKNINTIQSEYKERYEEFYHRFCEWEDGHAAEKVVKSVFISNIEN